MRVLRKNSWQTKIDGIRSQQIGESCGIQPINERVERTEWVENVTRMGTERLVKNPKKDIPDGR